MQALRTITLLLALAAGGLPSPAVAQADADTVEVIIRRLPGLEAGDYGDLRSYALEAADQRPPRALPMTHCQVWTVRRANIERLRAVAARFNMGLIVLDGAWTEIVGPRAAAAPTDAQMGALVGLARLSRATAGVGIMEAPPPNLVEYALTRLGATPTGGLASASIRLVLAGGRTVAAVRERVVVERDRVVWYGRVEGSSDPVTLIWWSTGRITGTVKERDRISQMRPLGNGMLAMVDTLAANLPDEHAPLSRARLRDRNLQDDPLVRQGDASLARPGAAGQPRPALPKQPAGEPTATGAQAVIDVMVAYTRAAARHYADIRLDLVELAIEETNQVLRNSGLDNVKVRLVHVHETDYVESGEHFDHVWRMADKGDGFMEEIPRLRDEKKADVVVLVVDDASGCGLATRVAADAEEGYAVVHHECAATSYSLAHEIGHLIGARHERALDRSSTPFPHGHGFVAPDLKWRTMMSYKASCGGCPRVPLWSSASVRWQGQAAGDVETDNARVIREQAERVAAFR
jgi:hypothetical protein